MLSNIRCYGTPFFVKYARTLTATAATTTTTVPTTVTTVTAATTPATTTTTTTPAIISVAITGDVANKQRVKGLPVTTSEQVKSICEAFEAGARHCHVHVRDENGKPSWRADLYKNVLDGVKRECPDMIVEFSTGNYATNITDRVACLHHKPHMASLTPGSINFKYSRESANQYMNTHSDISTIAQTMKDYNVKPAVCIFDVSMIYSCAELIERGLVSAPPHIYFVMGGHMALAAREPLLDFMIKESNEILPGRSWTGIGVGWNHKDIIKWTLKNGGHPRTGFEDNLMVKRGVIAKNNAELVQGIVALCPQFNRHPASTEETRNILTIQKPH